MPRGGKLIIEVRNIDFDQKTVIRDRTLEPGPYVMLAISDTGVGMTEEVKTHLFEPFFTTKGIGQRSGLGLATCYGIITQSGGDIRVYSEPGHGTTFKIYLPRIEKTVIPTFPYGVPDALPVGTERILIVEDDEPVRTLTHTILTQCGYTVELAHDGADAFARLEKDAGFALVITDVIMPRMSGRQLYDHVRKSLPDTKVLFISGYTDDALATRGILEHGFNFLEKPFTPSSLARQVRDLLDGSEHDTMFRRLPASA
jgi:CheY-like chemotaxis protein